MSASSYLVHAQKAVREVRKILSKGSNTRDPKNVAAMQCITQSRPKANQCVQDAAAKRKDRLDQRAHFEAVIRCFAESARQSHCGNCGEHAALAFSLLKDWGIKPLEFFKLGRSHDFVVIGRPINSSVTDPSTWANAVVCDPWHGKGEAYSAAQISIRMSGMYTSGSELRVVYRHEGILGSSAKK